MASNASAARKRHHRRHRRVPRPRDSSSSEEVETIDLDVIATSAKSNNSTTIDMTSCEQENENVDESPLVKIIERKQRKAWAKLVAPVDDNKIKKTKQPITTHFTRFLPKISPPITRLLDYIEHRNGYTIRSYFQFIVWLFYLNIFTFILCFACIILPTYIYSNTTDFSLYAMHQYNSKHNQSSEYCSLSDKQCEDLRIPLSDQGISWNNNNTCLSDSYTAASCCSLHAEGYFVNSSWDGENNWLEFMSDLLDGTGIFTVNRLFIGYYQNLTKPDDKNLYFQTYNMGLAIFLTTFICLLITGIIILRKYGDGMKRSYVQNESFQNELFQYIFSRWDYRTTNTSVARRHTHRFKNEIKNILFERNEKINFNFDKGRDKIAFQLKRIGVWLVAIIIFAIAIIAVYFTNRFAFQERAKKEMNSGTGSSRILDMAIEYLPSAVVSSINIISQLIFSYMKNFKLYSPTASLRHYLTRVIIMRLLLLFSFVFIVILQITCNSNQCGRQSELIDCAEIKGRATFIHCWETLIGQVIYRLVITDTVVMLIIHLIVDPLRSLLRRCCFPRTDVEEDGKIITTYAPPKDWFLFQPLEFEIGDYVLDLTYTQTLCWHGLFFCPFLPLIAAAKNILIFAVKLLSLTVFRKRSALELSPARTHHIFTGVLLVSFVCALLPITFLTTSLRPSRGCSPYRLYSHEPDFYIYYSVRNIFAQIQNKVLVNLLIKLTSAMVIVPVVLILLLFSCILNIRRNSYRGASVELYKLLYSSHKVHQLAIQDPLT